MTLKELREKAMETIAEEMASNVTNEQRSLLALQVMNLPIPYEPSETARNIGGTLKPPVFDIQGGTFR